MSPILLDTCAAIWLAEGVEIEDAAMEALTDAARTGEDLRISPITAWEIGLLASRGRLASPLTPETWFARLLSLPGLGLCALSPEILIASSFLPGQPPRDPADRIVTATARAFGYRLMTRDRILLDYAAAGHVQAIAC